MAQRAETTTSLYVNVYQFSPRKTGNSLLLYVRRSDEVHERHFNGTHSPDGTALLEQLLCVLSAVRSTEQETAFLSADAFISFYAFDVVFFFIFFLGVAKLDITISINLQPLCHHFFFFF